MLPMTARPHATSTWIRAADQSKEANMRKHPLLAFVTALTTCTMPGAIAAAGATTTPANQKALTSVAATRQPKHKVRHHAHLTPAQLTERRIHRARLARAKAHHLRILRHEAALRAKRAATAARIARGAKLRARPKVGVIEPYVTLGGKWASLRVCEAHGNYTENTGNGYYGAYQFSRSSWFAVGGSGLPSQASPKAQDAAALALFSRQGWHAWPVCSWRVGLA